MFASWNQGKRSIALDLKSSVGRDVLLDLVRTTDVVVENFRPGVTARLGVDYAATVSCYQADAIGRACGRCEACRLRSAGFAAAGLADPTRYQAL